MLLFKKKLRNSIGELNVNETTEITEHLRTYLRFYGLPLTNFTYHNGYIPVNNEKVLVQVFKPSKSKGTVYLLHGYFDHMGYLSPIVSHLLQLQYTVVGYDKIGHGLSSGKRAHIASFSHYVDTLDAVIKSTRHAVAEPFHIIGHSTGGATITEYVLENNAKQTFQNIILLAPLVRPVSWYTTVVLNKLMYPFVKKIPRKFRSNNDTSQFSYFRKKDPLQPREIPLSWVTAMMMWNKKMKSTSPVEKSVSIIQGKKDTVVAWRYNCKFLSSIFPESTVHYLEDGRHHIAIENENSKKQVLNIITNILNAN
jgi:alpha-beta hydrolase superfamily lysophospholipase